MAEKRQIGGALLDYDKRIDFVSPNGLVGVREQGRGMPVEVRAGNVAARTRPMEDLGREGFKARRWAAPDGE